MDAFRSHATWSAILIACVTAACASEPYRPLPTLGVSVQADALDVTIYQLIATPERYDGKLVSVIAFGYFETGFGSENRWAIFPTRDDMEHATCALVYIDLATELQPEAEKLAAFSDKYVFVSGVFEASHPLPPDVMLVNEPCPNAGILRRVSYVSHWEFGD
ncbi:hypothetical protein [Noviluteimonas gilva]|uniref:DUF3124 domain-containing protein n=1 Tax=Noviluteimonas gilva TaxID=2682097 RepID=A0A7C9HMK4_9GAMM|nr:hypothetical protein [Lysobacter gilvus]MUV14597.1 hypothetical protein [Lysobacter gilvus]